MNNLSHVFKKHGFNPSVAVFLKTQPKTHMFCSEDWKLWLELIKSNDLFSLKLVDVVSSVSSMS